MANAKRASMREGPLAALFRRTEEEDGSAAPGAPSPQGHEAAPQPRQAPLTPPVAQRAQQAPPAQASPERPAQAPPVHASAPERSEQAPPQPSVPHPSLGPPPATVAARAASPRVLVPTPQERLREAFSSERHVALADMTSGQP